MKNTAANHADKAEAARRAGNPAKARRHANLADEYAIGHTDHATDDAAHDAAHSAALAEGGWPTDRDWWAAHHEAEAAQHEADGNHAAANSHARQARRARRGERRADQA